MSDYALQAETEMWDEIVANEPSPWIVETSVKGAHRINRREYWTLLDATMAARRWSESNSTGHYWAVITHRGQEVARFNC